MKKHADIQVFGRVQGVCFRAYAHKKARNLGLAGYVKNLPDESVFLEAEGEEGALQTFVEWLHHGPPAARVTQVAVGFSEALKGFEDFEIRIW